MKKNCGVCGDKASILTRIKLNDGFLCSDCAKKCSEHLDDFDEITADEIKKHLVYRKRNLNSDMLKAFSETMSLGNYEILRIDENHNHWLLETEKRLKNENPDIFMLSQVTDVLFIRKKECLNNFNEDRKDNNFFSKFTSKKNRKPVYGYWFYVVIKVNHPCFTEINMRINKYIIHEKNQIEYLASVRKAQDIVDIMEELCDKAKKQAEAKAETKI